MCIVGPTPRKILTYTEILSYVTKKTLQLLRHVGVDRRLFGVRFVGYQVQQ